MDNLESRHYTALYTVVQQRVNTVMTARPGLGPIPVTVQSLLYMCYAHVAIDISNPATAAVALI